MELISIVKSHLPDALSRSMANIRFGLARLSIYDPLRSHTSQQDLVNFSLGSAIEACTQGGKQMNDFGIRIALHSFEPSANESIPRRQHTIVGLHSRKILLPSKLLAIDFAQISNEKGILLSSSA